MDNFITLSNRLLSRAPQVGIMLAQQFVNDAWHALQSRREWTWRRGHGTFAPPDLYNAGLVSTNVASGQPLLITGLNTTWTPNMIGRQIRAGGLLFPFYTITGWLSPTELIIDQPWAGDDLANASYTIQQIYFPVPQDFAYWYSIVSVKDGYRMWTNITEAEIDLMDPQRTTFGQSYCVALRDYTQIYQGVISQCLPLNSYAADPISTTTQGYSRPIPATYVVTITNSGVTGTATFNWTRIGQGSYSADIPTQSYPFDLADGVQVYFPDASNWTAGNTWIINAYPKASSGVPRYEMWPGPTSSQYLYPYQYIKKVYDLTIQQPKLPIYIAIRGEVLLEMALQKCAEFPGQDADHPNIYHDLRQAKYHEGRVLDMLIDLENDDENIGISQLDYQMYPLYPSPWLDGSWEQRHSPFLNG